MKSHFQRVELEGDEEEAVAPKLVRDPGEPTAAERAAHEATHLPFRSWCRHCVAGRQDNPPHRRREADKEDGTIPEVHLDYAFIRRDEEEEVLTMLVIKHRQSRAVRVWVVPRKGGNEDIAAEVAAQGLKDFGIMGAVILKCDNEAAILALRSRVMELHPGALAQEPAPGEHESNGVIENAVKLGKGLFRVLLFALEAKLRGRIPSRHAAFAWLASHTGDVVTKHLLGKDGRTPYERLYGKRLVEEGLEFGERLLWRPARRDAQGVLAEPRWEEGVWLGRRWGRSTHIIFSNGCVYHCRAVQRKPASERWSREAVEAIDVYPPPLSPEGGEAKDPAKIVQQASDDDVAAAIPAAQRRRPNPFYIMWTDLEQYGFTENCTRCLRMRRGLPCRGKKHSDACRERIEARLREAGDERIQRADARLNERIVDITGDLSNQAAAGPQEEEGGGDGDADGDLQQPRARQRDAGHVGVRFGPAEVHRHEVGPDARLRPHPQAAGRAAAARAEEARQERELLRDRQRVEGGERGGGAERGGRAGGAERGERRGRDSEIADTEGEELSP